MEKTNKEIALELRDFVESLEEEILDEWEDDFLIKEQCLRASFYYHLRKFLEEKGYFKKRIRILADYQIYNKEGKFYKIDLAVVQLVSKKESERRYYSDDFISEIILGIELKSSHEESKSGVNKDMNKLKELRDGIFKYTKNGYGKGYVISPIHKLCAINLWDDQAIKVKWVVGD